MPTQPLKAIGAGFAREADEIEAAFHSTLSSSVVNSYKIPYVPAVEGCITSLWDAWGRFNRSVIILSASGDVQGISGAIYSPGQPRTESQAIRKLVTDAPLQSNRIKLLGGEPIWPAPEMLLDVCQALDLAAVHPLHAAVTSHVLSLPYNQSTSNPIVEIRAVRNYCAHKSDETYRKMRRFFRPGMTNVHAHARQKVSGIPRFVHWIDCLKVIAEAGVT